MSKYTLTTEPALPAKCIGCNNDVKPDFPLIDTSASLDYYGAILLCQNCVLEMAKLLDLVPETELHKEVQLGNELAVRLQEANKKVEALEGVVSAYGLGQFTIDSEPVLDIHAAKSEKSGSTGKKSGSGSKGKREPVPEKSEPGLFE